MFQLQFFIGQQLPQNDKLPETSDYVGKMSPTVERK